MGRHRPSVRIDGNVALYRAKHIFFNLDCNIVLVPKPYHDYAVPVEHYLMHVDVDSDEKMPAIWQHDGTFPITRISSRQGKVFPRRSVFSC